MTRPNANQQAEAGGDPHPHNPPPRDALPHDQRRARRPDTTAPLKRSKDDRVLGGVIGGIAGYVGADPRTLRLLIAVLTIVTGGVLGVVYGLLWLLLPAAP